MPQTPERTRTEGGDHAESLELPRFKSRRGLHLRIIHTSLCSRISHKSSTDVDMPNALLHIFSSPHMHVLTWIDYIATYWDLKRLINTGKAIKKLPQKRAKHTSTFRCGEEVTLLDSWLIDVVPLVANFRKKRRRKSLLKTQLLSIISYHPSANQRLFLTYWRGLKKMSDNAWQQMLRVEHPGRQI
jgi:hypothetical protein